MKHGLNTDLFFAFNPCFIRDYLMLSCVFCFSWFDVLELVICFEFGAWRF